MLCKNCWKEYEDGLTKCPYCGTDVTEIVAGGQANDEDLQENLGDTDLNLKIQNNNQTNQDDVLIKDKKKKRNIILGVIGVVVVVIGAILISKINAFNSGVKLLKEGKFDDAISIFEELKGFNGADKKVTEVKLAKADNLLENSGFDEAIAIYTELNNIDKVNKAKYLQAVASLTDPTIEGLKNGAHILMELGEYEDSKEKLKEIFYTLGNLEYNEEKYEDAVSHFNLADDYNNSDEMLKKSRGKVIDIYLAVGDYETAYTKATEQDEKNRVVFENRVAYLSNLKSNRLKKPDSFVLSKAYYYFKDGDQRIVLYSGGQNGFGSTSYGYDYCNYKSDDDEWTYVGSVDDLGEESFSYYDTEYDIEEKLVNNIIRGYVNAVIEDHVMLDKEGVMRINALFEEGKLDEISMLDVEENQKSVAV